MFQKGSEEIGRQDGRCAATEIQTACAGLQIRKNAQRNVNIPYDHIYVLMDEIRVVDLLDDVYLILPTISTSSLAETNVEIQGEQVVLTVR